MTTQTTVRSNPAALLRTMLYGNTLFSLASGLASIVGAGMLSRFSGLEPQTIFIVLGVTLILYAGFLWRVAAPQISERRLVWSVIVADSLWVIGSILLLVLDLAPLTIGGKWMVGILADLVAVFAVLQYIGLRRVEKA